MRVVIVSRHPATVKYLKNIWPEAEVVDHITDPGKYRNCLLVGNLPLPMVAELLRNGNRFVMVSLNVPKELRGKELGEEELKKYVKLYEITRLELSEFVIS